jgi:hypothetical protein
MPADIQPSFDSSKPGLQKEHPHGLSLIPSMLDQQPAADMFRRVGNDRTQ